VELSLGRRWPTNWPISTNPTSRSVYEDTVLQEETNVGNMMFGSRSRTWDITNFFNISKYTIEVTVFSAKKKKKERKEKRKERSDYATLHEAAPDDFWAGCLVFSHDT
jgi:hypothetical protein